MEIEYSIEENEEIVGTTSEEWVLKYKDLATDILPTEILPVEISAGERIFKLKYRIKYFFSNIFQRDLESQKFIFIASCIKKSKKMKLSKVKYF